MLPDVKRLVCFTLNALLPVPQKSKQGSKNSFASVIIETVSHLPSNRKAVQVLQWKGFGNINLFASLPHIKETEQCSHTKK